MQPLDPLRIPLQGQQLIEASAGTGKTFTIGLLYLRLLLERTLSVEQILVVTFTNSATEELRTRIRGRIQQARDLLSGRTASGGDPLLDHLLSTVSDRQAAIQRLTSAFTQMDKAAIHTIHGYCQRMLQEQAFACANPFALTFLENEEAIRREICEDFWRQRFYPAEAAEAAWATASWSTPAALLKKIEPLLGKFAPLYRPVIDHAELADLRRTCEAALARVRLTWPSAQAEVAELLAQNKCLSRDKKEGYHPDRVAAALQGLTALSAQAHFPWQLPPAVELLAASVMADKLKGKKVTPEHDFFALFDHFYQPHTELTEKSRIAVQFAALQYLQEELTRRKEALAALYFDDLLLRLDEALQGTDGASLGARIRKQFPVALVDEFQDTDPLQYRIFHAIYASEPGCGLFMIGDPKQAIYSFRGADIFTYIKARRDTPEQGRFTMATNYRATSPMVRAVNSLFATTAPFLFARDIEFHPVTAAGKADQQPLLRAGHNLPPFTCLYLPHSRLATKPEAPLSKEVASEHAAAWCAREIALLLSEAAQGRALIGEQPVRAGDLAILTRTHREATLIQEALAELGLASVSHSQASVFTTSEAGELRTLLRALLCPSDEGLVRNSLVTDFFGLTAAELDELHHREELWEELLGQLQDYHQRWQRSGFMPMFQSLLVERHVVGRVLARSDGERRLTNHLHLAELLQERASKHPGMEELLHWLDGLIRQPTPEATGGTDQLRLESDENLIRIVTIHKSKGLEYPIVFLPFLWSSRPLDPKGDALLFHEERDCHLIVELGAHPQESYELAERERLAEDLRLLYVALTRARYCCYFCWGVIKGLENSALAYLLHGRSVPLDDHSLRGALARLNAHEELLVVQEYPDDFSAPRLTSATAARPLTPRPFRGAPDLSWRLTSYSQLVSELTIAAASPQSAEEPVALPPPTEPSIFSFPRGTVAGTCLHAILEQLDFAAPRPPELTVLVANQLARAGIGPQWCEVVVEWLGHIVETPLERGSDFCLSRIERRDRLNELNFHFPLQRFDLRAGNRLLAAHGLSPLAHPASTLQGLMTGFIDLVFRRGERYYLADYKSNYLGPDLSCYRREVLGAAMAEHRYDLQYLIYCVALHRYLGARIKDYDYERHFGGVYYLFLRGLNREAGPASGIYRDRPALTLIRELDRCCRGGKEEA